MGLKLVREFSGRKYKRQEIGMAPFVLYAFGLLPGVLTSCNPSVYMCVCVCIYHLKWIYKVKNIESIAYIPNSMPVCIHNSYYTYVPLYHVRKLKGERLACLWAHSW